MNGEKNTFLLINIEWRTVKTETGEINQVLSYKKYNRIEWIKLK